MNKYNECELKDRLINKFKKNNQGVQSGGPKEPLRRFFLAPTTKLLERVVTVNN